MKEYSTEEYIRLAERPAEGSGPDGNQCCRTGEIAVTKSNFLRLKGRLEKDFGLSVKEELGLFPVKDIIPRWLSYVRGINKRLSAFGKGLCVDDRVLASLLLKLSRIKDDSRYERAQLQRALGLICEDTFTGPYSIVVDLLHYCNTDCLHCWLHSPQNPHKDPDYLKGKMSLEMFRGIAESAGRMSVQKICLLANGEPLMHPNIKEIVGVCRDNGLEFETITNGFFLDEELARYMLDSGATFITFSLPAATPSSYKQVCPRSPESDFHRISENIRFLSSYKKEKGKKTEIHMTHVIHNLNCKDLFGFVEMDMRLGVDAVLFKIILLDEQNKFLKLSREQVDYLRNNMPRAVKQLKDSGIRTDELSGVYLDSYEQSEGSRTHGMFARQGCFTGWSFCNIQLDGEVLFCCGNKMVDSLRNYSLEEIWFSEKYNRYRVAAKHMKDNRDVEFCRGEKLYDRQCDSCENVNEHNHIVKYLQENQLEEFI